MARASSRGRVRPRPETSTAITTPKLKVGATATDPFVPEFANDQTANVLKSLSGIVKSGVGIAQVGADEAFEQGAREWRPGTDPNEDSFLPSQEIGFEESSRSRPQNLMGKIFTGAYQAGFDTIHGKKKANDYYNEAYIKSQELMTAGASIKELNEALSVIRSKYVGSMVSDVELDAFLPKAAAVEERLTHDHVVAGVAREHKAAAEIAKGNMRSEMEELIAPTLRQFYYMDSNGEEQRLTMDALANGEGIEAYVNNIDEINEAIAKPLQRLHANSIKELGGNFTKPQITGMYVDLLTGLALQTHTPEFLNATRIKGEDGVSIQDRNSPRGAVLDDINRSYAAAESRRFSVKQQLRQYQRESAQETFNKDSVDLMMDLNKAWQDGPQANAAALINAEDRIEVILAKNPGFITREAASSLYAVLNTKKKQGTHPIQTPDNMAGKFWGRVASQTASVDWVLANKDVLSEADFNTYLAKAAQIEYAHKTRNAGEKSRIFGPRQRATRYLSSLRGLYNPKDPWGTGFLDDQGANVLQDVKSFIEQEGAALELANGGTPLTDAQLDDLILRSEKRIPPYVYMTEEDIKEVIQTLVDRGDMPGPTDEEIFRWWPGHSAREREAVSRFRGQRTPATKE
jgi:hypothetical protein